MANFAYKWRKAKPGTEIEPAPPLYERAVQESFYAAEILDNQGSLADFGIEMSPGLDAALRGLWRGKNRAENEEWDKKKSSRSDAREKEKQRQRYAGGE